MTNEGHAMGDDASDDSKRNVPATVDASAVP